MKKIKRDYYLHFLGIAIAIISLVASIVLTFLYRHFSDLSIILLSSAMGCMFITILSIIITQHFFKTQRIIYKIYVSEDKKFKNKMLYSIWRDRVLEWDNAYEYYNFDKKLFLDYMTNSKQF